jgi:phage-related minor tail protein
MVKQELTAADVWAILADLAKKQEETDRQLKEFARQSEEAAKRRAESERLRAEAARQRAESEKLRAEEIAKEKAERAEMERKKAEEMEREKAERAEKEREEKAERAEMERKRAEEMEKEKAERAEKEKKRAEEMEKERAERKEADRRFDERMERLNRHLGYFGQSLGDVVELILVPGIREKMNAFGHSFTRMGPNKIYNKHNKKTLAEIDLLLENCEEAMAVEIKTDLSVKWVNRHLDRLELLRKNEDITGLKGRILYAAVAGITIDEDARELALEKGMYVIDMKEDEERLEVMAPKKEIGKW